MYISWKRQTFLKLSKLQLKIPWNKNTEHPEKKQLGRSLQQTKVRQKIELKAAFLQYMNKGVKDYMGQVDACKYFKYEEDILLSTNWSANLDLGVRSSAPPVQWTQNTELQTVPEASHVGALYECACKRVNVAFSVKILGKSRKVLKKLE